jgi:hypothetical protein
MLSMNDQNFFPHLFIINFQQSMSILKLFKLSLEIVENIFI